MNKFKRPTFRNRLKNAINAFKCRPVGSVHFGLDVKYCNQCEYRSDVVGLKDILRNAINAYVFELDQHDYESDDEIYSVLLNQFGMTDADYVDIMGCTFKQHR